MQRSIHCPVSEFHCLMSDSSCCLWLLHTDTQETGKVMYSRKHFHNLFWSHSQKALQLAYSKAEVRDVWNSAAFSGRYCWRSLVHLPFLNQRQSGRFMVHWLASEHYFSVDSATLLSLNCYHNEKTGWKLTFPVLWPCEVFKFAYWSAAFRSIIF